MSRKEIFLPFKANNKTTKKENTRKKLCVKWDLSEIRIRCLVDLKSDFAGLWIEWGSRSLASQHGVDPYFKLQPFEIFLLCLLSTSRSLWQEQRDSNSLNFRKCGNWAAIAPNHTDAEIYFSQNEQFKTYAILLFCNRYKVGKTRKHNRFEKI